MYVCMCVYICMYTYIHTYTHTYIHTHTNTLVCEYMRIRIHTIAYTLIQSHACLYCAGLTTTLATPPWPTCSTAP